MNFHKIGNLIIFSLLSGALLGACAIDERTGKALADAAANGPIRSYAAVQAATFAETSQALVAQAAPEDGSPPDLDAARNSWRKARATYDRGVAVYLVVAPALDFALDGTFDDPVAMTGLRYLERALFATPPAASATLGSLSRALRDDARALYNTVPDAAQPIAAADLLGSMAAVAAQMAGKLDGMTSPYAGAALLSLQSNLIGLQTMYDALAEIVRNADPTLDAQITTQLASLGAQLGALQSLDAVTDKTALLRECATLSAALRRIGPALGLLVTTIDLS